MRVNTTQITNVYVNRTVIVNNNSHVAFNGGRGGVAARPTSEQERFAHERHTPAVASQREQEHAASQNRALFASTNHGRPAVAATARPGEFSGKGVVAARAAGGTYHAPAMSPRAARGAAPAGNRPGEPHSAARTAPEKSRPTTHAATAKESSRAAPKETSREAKPAREPKAGRKPANQGKGQPKTREPKASARLRGHQERARAPADTQRPPLRKANQPPTSPNPPRNRAEPATPRPTRVHRKPARPARVTPPLRSGEKRLPPRKEAAPAKPTKEGTIPRNARVGADAFVRPGPECQQHFPFNAERSSVPIHDAALAAVFRAIRGAAASGRHFHLLQFFTTAAVGSSYV